MTGKLLSAFLTALIITPPRQRRSRGKVAIDAIELLTLVLTRRLSSAVIVGGYRRRLSSAVVIGLRFSALYFPY
jgi:hypothetical protein